MASRLLQAIRNTPIDWSWVSAAVSSKGARAELAVFRKAFDDAAAANASKIDPMTKPADVVAQLDGELDWASYKQQLDPKVVDTIREDVRKHMLDYLQAREKSLQALVESAAKFQDELMAEVAAKQKEQAAAMASLESELDALKRKGDVSNKSLEQMFAENPAIVGKIESDLANFKYRNE